MRHVGMLLNSVALVVVLAVFPPVSYSYQEVAVVDGGTISGKVVFHGPLPPPKMIIPTKDQEVCGGIRKEPRIILNEDRSLRDVVVFLKAVEGGKPWEPPAQPPKLTNLKCNFVPHIQAARAGSIIEIISADPVLHATHGFLGKRTVFSVTLPNKGDRVKRPLKKAGIIRVECDAHGWMQAWIYSADSPYYGLTGENGRFTITDIPPGTYTLVVWQEYTGRTEIPVTVKAQETVSVDIELKK